MLRDMIKVGPSASALANYEKYRILKTSKSSLSHDETKVATKPLTYDDTLIPTHKDKVQGSYKNV